MHKYKVVGINKKGEEVGLLGELDSEKEAQERSDEFNIDLIKFKEVKTTITYPGEDPFLVAKDKNRIVEKTIVKKKN